MDKGENLSSNGDRSDQSYMGINPNEQRREDRTKKGRNI